MIHHEYKENFQLLRNCAVDVYKTLYFVEIIIWKFNCLTWVGRNAYSKSRSFFLSLALLFFRSSPTTESLEQARSHENINLKYCFSKMTRGF